MKRIHGFTLIELMITVAIAAVLLGLAVPSFQTLIVGSRLTTQTNELVAAINTARSEAIKRNRNINLCRVADAAATACANATGNWEHWIITPGSNVIIRRGSFNRFGNTIGITSSLANGTLRLSSDGLTRTSGNAMATGQTITVCATNGPTENNRRITLGAGSRVSTTSFAGACP